MSNRESKSIKSVRSKLGERKHAVYKVRCCKCKGMDCPNTLAVKTDDGWVCVDCQPVPTRRDYAREKAEREDLAGKEPRPVEPYEPMARRVLIPDGWPPSPLHLFLESIRDRMGQRHEEGGYQLPAIRRLKAEYYASHRETDLLIDLRDTKNPKKPHHKKREIDANHVVPSSSRIPKRRANYIANGGTT